MNRHGVYIYELQFGKEPSMSTYYIIGFLLIFCALTLLWIILSNIDKSITEISSTVIVSSSDTCDENVIQTNSKTKKAAIAAPKEYKSNESQFRLFVSGYMNQYKMYICDDIIEIIRLYSWNIPSRSMRCIAATHLIASIINEYFNDENNRCEYSSAYDGNNDDLDILKYIYIRGGALRDCYLLREIKDIDIVINIHELSKKYLLHLITYHSNIEQENKNCKCVLWRHYLNKFNPDTFDENDMDNNDEDDDISDSENENKEISADDIDKILQFEKHIVRSNYLLNAKFITNEILSTSEKLRGHLYVEPRFFDLQWHIKLRDYNYKGLYLDNIEFDVDDQTDQYGKFQTLKQGNFTNLNEKELALLLEEINNYKSNHKNKSIISIPIYPFPFNVNYYDFTINSMHIDLYNVLINDKFNFDNNKHIDFNWENKVINKKYNSDIINKYNVIGINHINNKILIAPNLNVVNEITAMFYFWRLVKSAQRFIHSIKDRRLKKVNKWKIDKKLLIRTKQLYTTWFNDEFINNNDRELNAKFIKKFYQWNIQNENDIIDRFHVFRYMKFENYLKKQITKYPLKLHRFLKGEQYGYQYQDVIKKCYKQFAYPQHSDLVTQERRPRIRDRKQFIINYDRTQNWWLTKTAFDYNYTKCYKRFKNGICKKSNYNKDKNCRWKTNKSNKKQSYFKRKKDKKMNAIQKKKFKRQYLMSLQY